MLDLNTLLNDNGKILLIALLIIAMLVVFVLITLVILAILLFKSLPFFKQIKKEKDKNFSSSGTTTNNHVLGDQYVYHFDKHYND